MRRRTPTELAVEFWGPGEGNSRSRGARIVRRIARDLFPTDVPGHGGQWELTDAHIVRIRERVMQAQRMPTS